MSAVSGPSGKRSRWWHKLYRFVNWNWYRISGQEARDWLDAMNRYRSE